jgi:hypothetical protein
LDYHILKVAQAFREKGTAISPKLAGTISALYAYQGMNQN